MSDYFHNQALGEGKRMRTRGRLIDTAINVFSEKGIEAASIHEITAMAGLANGTFYNHFRDKDELAGCVSEAIVLEIGKRLADEMQGLESGAVRTTVASWAFLRIAVAMGDWARVLAAEYQRSSCAVGQSGRRAGPARKRSSAARSPSMTVIPRLRIASTQGRSSPRGSSG